VREQDHSPSLLPYLALGNAGAFLKIDLVSEDLSGLTGDSFPFLLISDSDPLTRLIKAEFTTDSGSTIRDVFLLVQRDDYRLSTNQLAPLTNADIERFWQETLRYHRRNRNGHPLITLQQQIDKTGNLTPFQPLFFCGTAKAFFHPPCPSCGLPLRQCSDDQLLDSLGLQPYALSLSRYLFCSSCYSSGRDTPFYERRKRALGPPVVKDSADLIRAFEQLVREGNEASGLPCITCSQKEFCFGSGASLVTPPITPFSFYPFFMLIHEAMSVNGLDFLALTSGASFDQLTAHLRGAGEPGRALYVDSSRPDRGPSRSFLFDNEARLFLEILYLKLSFLEQIVAELFAASDSRQLDPLLFVDKIWVKFNDRPGLLPYLWNYELNFIDLVRHPLGLPARPPMPPAYSCHLLGLIWFVVLLANSGQSISEVHQAVEHARDRVFRDHLPIPTGLTADTAFFPENIFWHPVPFEMAADWRQFWEEAISIGWSLLQAGVQDISSPPGDELVRQIEDLRTRIKRRLFSEIAVEKETDRSLENVAIQQILARITANWSQAPVSKPGEDLEKTLVLSRETGSETPSIRELEPEKEAAAETVILAPSKPPVPVVPADDEEIFLETVLVSGRGTEETLPPDASPSRKAAEDLSATVILGAPETDVGFEETLVPGRPSIPSEKTKEAGEPPEEMAETIILGRSKTPPSPEAPLQGLQPAAGERISSDDILPETVVLSPAGARQPRLRPDRNTEEHDLAQTATPSAEGEAAEDLAAKKPKRGEEEDELSATIILTPSRDRDQN